MPTVTPSAKTDTRGGRARVRSRVGAAWRTALPLLLAALAAHAATAAAQTPAGRAESVLRGRVVYADTGEPVRRAAVSLVHLDKLFGDGQGTVVELRARARDAARNTATNARGEFAFERLPAGRYAVSVGAPGALAFGVGHARAASVLDAYTDGAPREERVVTLDGADAAERVVRLRRGGAISGRVLYADGDAATNVTLSLFCRERETFTKCGGSAKADDRGHYRFEGLAPGEYTVGAAENNVGVEETSANGPAAAFTSSFHPAARSLRAAESVSVEEGREAVGVDVTFADGLRRVAGMVKWARDGRPPRHATVRLQSLDSAPAAQPAATSLRFVTSSVLGGEALASAEAMTTAADEEGNWAFAGVPDGEYLLTVLAAAAGPTGGGRTGAGGRGSAGERSPASGFVQKARQVSVSGGDVNGFHVALTAGARLSGRVVAEGAGATAGPPTVYLQARPASATQAQPFPTAADENGRFEIDGVGDGEYFLEVYLDTPRAGAGVYVRSVTAADGTDLTRVPLRVEAEADIDGLRVVLAADGATLDGRVAPAPAGGGNFIVTSALLLPADARLRGASRHARCAAPVGLDGHFTLHCPPGDFLLFLLRDGEAFKSAEDYAGRPPSLRVTLSAGERREVEVPAPPER